MQQVLDFDAQHAQEDLFEPQWQGERSQLDELLDRSRMYRNGSDYSKLMEFVVRMNNFAPFNAMLLQIQKPGVLYAASENEWEKKGRTVREGARPLLIMWPFGPVALVYDVEDTDGPPLPEGVRPFRASGEVTVALMNALLAKASKKQIACYLVDAGEGSAGAIRVKQAAVAAQGGNKASPGSYVMKINRHHAPAVQFATLVHELGHLYLGHLGRDAVMNIPARRGLAHAQRELEAESVSYLICQRRGVESNAHEYLSGYVKSETSSDILDIYQIMRAAGQVESLLGLTAHMSFG